MKFGTARPPLSSAQGFQPKAGLPGWEKLLDSLRRRASLNRITFSPRNAPIRFQETRDALEGHYVDALKAILDPVHLELPDSYHVIGEIPFKRFATTNFDELLYLLATAVHCQNDDSILVYPRRNIEDKRYLYLHGRLRTSTSGRDLILCADDYKRGYEPMTGAARAVFSYLLDTPVLFVGTSLSDPTLWRLLQEVQMAMFSDSEIDGTLFTSQMRSPRWYAILPANPKSLLRISDESAAAIRLQLSKVDMEPIVVEAATRKAAELEPVTTTWYVHDQNHTNLGDLISRLQRMTEGVEGVQGDQFLTIAQQLEEVGQLADPSPDQVARLRLLFSSEHNRRHFFLHANPSWLPILWREGELTRYREPQFNEDGSSNVYSWDAGRFVVRSAASHPTVIAEMIESVKTANWLVTLDLARALKNLPPSLVSDLGGSVSSWFDSRHLRFSPLASILLDVLEDLVAKSEWDAALDLFRILARWEADGDETPCSLLREYDFEHLVTGPGHQLAAARPVEVLSILSRQLSGVLSSSQGYFSRSAIEDTDQDEFPSDFDWLVIGVRNVLLRLADTNAEFTADQLKRLLRDPLMFNQRLAFFVLTERPKFIQTIDPDLVFQSDVDEYHLFHESMRLVSLRYYEFSPLTKARIHRQIARLLSGEERPSDGRGYDRIRAWRLLNVMPETSLDDDERQTKAELNGFLGLPEHPLFLNWTSGVEAIGSPASAEVLQRYLDEEGPIGLLEILRNPAAYFEIKWHHQAEMVWGEISALAKDRPQEFLRLADYLSVSDFPGAGHYLSAYAELSRQERKFDWLPLVQTCSRLSRGDKLGVTDWSISHVLLKSVQNINNPIPRSHLRSVESIASRILGRNATPLASISTIQNDLPGHQLNSPAGAAAETVLQIIRRRILDRSVGVARSSGNVKPPKGGLNSDSRRLLRKHIVSGWGGTEFQFAIGEWANFLTWTDPRWLDGELDDLLPLDNNQGDNRSGAWRAFWSGYLTTRALHQSTMLALRPKYREIIENLTWSKDRIFLEPVMHSMARSGGRTSDATSAY